MSQRLKPTLAFAPLQQRKPRLGGVEREQSPGSPEVGEEHTQAETFRKLSVPRGISKEGKNPLTNLAGTSRPPQARTSSLDHTAFRLAQEHEELTTQLSALEDRLRKLRRVRVLYVERDRQAKELQDRLSRLLQDIEELREANPHVAGGLEELMEDLEDDDGSADDAVLVRVDSLYRDYHPRKVWRDPVPAVTQLMHEISAKMRTVIHNF